MRLVGSLWALGLGLALTSAAKTAASTDASPNASAAPSTGLSSDAAPGGGKWKTLSRAWDAFTTGDTDALSSLALNSLGLDAPTTTGRPPRTRATPAPANRKPPPPPSPAPKPAQQNCLDASIDNYDPQTFAKTAEEAIQNFPDLSRSKTFGEDEMAPPLRGRTAAGPQADEAPKRTNPRCQSNLILRFQKVGLVKPVEAGALRRKMKTWRGGPACTSSSRWRIRSLFQGAVNSAKAVGERTYTKLVRQALASSDSAGPGGRPRRPTKDVLNACPALNADAGAAWASVLAQNRADMREELKKNRGRTLSSDSAVATEGDWSNDPRFPGRSSLLSCARRGDPESDGGGGWVSQCNQCWVIRTLPDGYVVPMVNELVCGSDDGTTRDDIKCLGGFGQCHQRTESRRVPFRDPRTRRVRFRYIQVRTCCDCKVLNGSPLHKFISK